MGKLESNLVPRINNPNPAKQQYDCIAVPVPEPVNETVDGKAQCLRATYYKDGIRNMVGNTIDRKTCVAEPVRIGTIENDAKNQTFDSQQYRVYSPDAKSVTPLREWRRPGRKNRALCRARYPGRERAVCN